MKEFIIIGIVLLLLAPSCSTPGNTATSSQPNFVPDLPYNALDRGKLDTTYDYDILKHPIDAVLPDSIFGKNVVGTAEFYSVIDASKNIQDIKLIACRFNDKTHLIYKYDEKLNKEVDIKLNNFLTVFMKDKPFIQTKAASAQQHLTYCFVRFIK